MQITNNKLGAALGFLSILTVIFFNGCFFRNSSISGRVIITAGGLQTLSATYIPLSTESVISAPDAFIGDNHLNKEAPEQEFVPDEIIVKYKPGVNRALIEQSMSGSGYFITKSDNNIGNGGISLIRLAGSEKTPGSSSVTKERTLKEVERLNSLTYVEYAEPNYIYSTQFIPDDQYYSRQWHLPLIKIDRVWDDSSLTLLNDLSSVTVAVIDTGIVRYITDHPDLTGIFRNEYDFVSDIDKSLDGDGPDNDATDIGTTFHGTHLSGIIGALTNNFTGVAGVAGGNSSGVKIMPLRAIGKDGKGSGYDIAQAILYAAGLNNQYSAPPGQKADIINMSFGSRAESSYLRVAVESAYNAGVTLVAAAGNEITGVPFYPAAYQHVISVASVSAGAERAFYSNYGDFIDIAAPGGDMRFDLDFDGHSDGIYSTLFNGNDQFIYDYMQGTSMAASHVAGAAALIVKGLQENPENPIISPSLIRDILINTAIDLGDPGFYGAGLLNIHGAVSRALGQPAPQIPVLDVNPKTVRLEGSKTTGSFTLKNISSSDTIIINEGGISVVRDPDGLISGIYPDSGSVGTDGLKVNVNLNSDGFKSGASLFALIEITDSTGYKVPVNVVYKYVGEVYVVAWPLSSFPSSLPVAKDSPGIAAIAVTDYEKGYRYTLEGLEPGKYVVGASTDRDNDNFIFEALEEIFGFFPDLRYATIMDLKAGSHRADVDFQVIDAKL